MSESFPVVGALNKTRHDLFEKTLYYGLTALYEFPNTRKVRMVTCLGHKALTVITIPTNIAAIGLGTIGMATTACTLGAFKVAIFAATLGHVKPEFPIGFLWLKERTFASLTDLWKNILELQQEFSYFAFTKLPGGISIRFHEAWLKVVKDEKSSLSSETFPGIQTLDQTTKSWSCFQEEKRTLNKWVGHKMLSLVNIPANLIAAGLAGACIIPTFVLTAGKIAFCGMTGYQIKASTGFGYFGSKCLVSSHNVARNTFELIADGGILIYKAAEILHLKGTITKTHEIAEYALKAIAS